MEGKIKIGPVGSDTHVSKTWDEGSHNGIIYQIFLSHGPAGILSIQFQFLMDGKLVLSDLHGQKSTGYMFNVITLDYPHEYITGISGTHTTAYSDTLHIKSLKFITNTKEYGPFGSSISIPAKNLGCKQEKFEFKLGKFLCQFGGFFGTYDASGIQCLGLYLQPTTIIPKTGTSDSEDTE